MEPDENVEQKTDGASSPVPSPSPTEILRVDDRLIVLERASGVYRAQLCGLEDALINQIVTLGVLELVFAVFLAMTVWSQYHKVTP